jgi:metallophosphoesterase (TIGR00282 family)
LWAAWARSCAEGLRALVDHYDVDLTIANAENAAAGFGLTRDIGQTLLDWGIDVMTSGNHIWDKKEVLEYIPVEPRLLRPANYPAGVPGRGSCVAQTRDGRSVAVINVMGRVFMAPLDDPFAVALREIEAVRHRARIIVVDMHAEATSEKIAMGWHLDGRVTAVIGTHTHVQTPTSVSCRRHGVPHRCRDDGPPRLDNRNGEGTIAGPIPQRDACEIRARQRQSAAERRGHRSG